MTPSPLTRVPGWVWMVLCAMLFATMGMLTKVLVVHHGVNVFWIGFVRFLLGTAIILIPGWLGAWSLKIHHRPLFVLRGLAGSSGVFLIFVAIAYVGLGRGMVLAYLMGVFGALSGIYILKEKPTAAVFAAVILGTLGVLLGCGARLPQGAEWYALGAAVLSGVTLSLVRLMRRTDSNPVVLLSQGVWGTLILALPALLHEPPQAAIAWAILLGLSLIDIAGQLCMTQGLSMLVVARGAALMMLTPIFSLLAGVMLLGERLTSVQWLGCALVLGASLVAIVGRRGAINGTAPLPPSDPDQTPAPRMAEARRAAAGDRE